MGSNSASTTIAIRAPATPSSVQMSELRSATQ